MGLHDWLDRLDYSLLLPCLARLPVPWAYRLADLHGWFRYRQQADSRRHALASVAAVFPHYSPHRRRKVVLEQFRVLSRDRMESLWFRRPREFFESFVSVQGLTRLRATLEAGKGALLFSGHFGSIGLFFVVMGRWGIPLNIVGRSLDPQENPLPPALRRFAERRVSWIEEAVGRPFILTGRGNYPRMLEKLRGGEILMLLIDVVPNLLKRTVPVPFLGQPARLGDGIAKLYLETRVPVFQWSIRFERPHLRQQIQIEEVTGELESLHSSREIMALLAARLEEKIRRHPEHWVLWDSWIHFRDPHPRQGSVPDQG